MSSNSQSMMLSVNQWNPSANKFMAPRVNEKGGKAISVISKISNRSLHLILPRMMTFGIDAFTNEDGSQGDSFGMSLCFPLPEYKTDGTDELLEKLKGFQEAILDAAVENSELWWGEKLDRAILKHTLFPILKFPFVKGTKKVDTTRPPSLRAKVPCYGGKWNVELYDTNKKLLFPSEMNEDATPMDFVPKLSQVACILQCGGIWIGGKGWGVTWKLVQAVVKPREVQSVLGQCHIPLDETEKVAIEQQELIDEIDDVLSAPEPLKLVIDTNVDDSDNEEDAVEEVVPAMVAALNAVSQEADEKPKIKKIIKKPEPTATVAVEEPEPVKKKVIKKKVVA